MTLLLDEAGADEVERIVEGEEDILLPFMTVMEVRYNLLRLLPPSEVETAMAALRDWPADIPESTPQWGRLAADIKSRGGLSVADAWIASLALLRDARLVHKDSEFDAVEGLQALKLP